MKYTLITLLFVLTLTACTSQAPLSDVGSESTWLPTVSRIWPRPLTSDAPIGTNIAHQQLDQISPIEIQEQLRTFLSQLSCMTSWPTKISVAWARAVFTSDPTAPTAVADERIHLHPSVDGSLHIALPDAQWTQTIHDLWRWEAHPRNPTTAMIYGPRNSEELTIVQNIITAVYALHTLEACDPNLQ